MSSDGLIQENIDLSDIYLAVPKLNIFGSKIIEKSGLEKNILKFLHTQFYFPFFIKLPKMTNSVTKMKSFAHGGIDKIN